ncbi:hypothetical protein BJ912DRAFT_1106276 [Pholiota molesta]|nr:hypothetical protein BJ912DRAFT_1106276 [Pholiota molesta]
MGPVIGVSALCSCANGSGTSQEVRVTRSPLTFTPSRTNDIDWKGLRESAGAHRRRCVCRRPQVVRVEIPRGTDRPSVRCRGNELGRTVNASSRRLEPVSYVPCRPCHPSALWRLCPAMGPAARARARQCMAGEKIKKGGAMCGDESAPCSRTLALRCAPSLRICFYVSVLRCVVVASDPLARR